MNPRRFIRTNILGISDKDLGDWTDADFAHYAILMACMLIASVVSVGGAVAVDRPALAAVAMICFLVFLWQLVFSILAWNIHRAQTRRPPPRP